MGMYGGGIRGEDVSGSAEQADRHREWEQKPFVTSSGSEPRHTSRMALRRYRSVRRWGERHLR